MCDGIQRSRLEVSANSTERVGQAVGLMDGSCLSRPVEMRPVMWTQSGRSGLIKVLIRWRGVWWHKVTWASLPVMMKLWRLARGQNWQAGWNFEDWEPFSLSPCTVVINLIRRRSHTAVDSSGYNLQTRFATGPNLQIYHTENCYIINYLEQCLIKSIKQTRW